MALDPTTRGRQTTCYQHSTQGAQDQHAPPTAHATSHGGTAPDTTKPKRNAVVVVVPPKRRKRASNTPPTPRPRRREGGLSHPHQKVAKYGSE